MLQAKKDRPREKEILQRLAATQSQEVQMFRELLGLRLERYKDALISTGCDLKRGMATEARELIKELDRVT